MKTLWIAPLAAASLAVPALAQQPIDPKSKGSQSGVTLPREVEGLPIVKTETRSSTNAWQGYAKSGEAVTIYVFRAAHPNAALWFERADTMVGLIWKQRGLGQPGPVRTFRLGNVNGDNAMRRTYAMSGEGKSTAVAVVQLGQWIVKVRSTSALLDVASQDARMDRILATLGLPAEARRAYPVVLPQTCVDEPSDFAELLGSEVVTTPAPEEILGVGLTAAMVGRAAAGETSDGLGSAPEKWCRSKTEVLRGMAVLYRPKDAKRRDWTALLADSGTAVAGFETILSDAKAKGQNGGALIVNDWDKAAAVLIAKGIPAPSIGIEVGFRYVTQGGPSYAVVPYGTTEIDVSIPNK